MYQILIVEDDLDMQKLLVDYLKKSGMEAVATHSPNEALEMLKSKRNFDLAVLDIMLPEMDGLELCKKIREISDLPIIMSSARGDIGSKILGFERGADDYLAKPIEKKELIRVLQEYLTKKMEQLINEVNSEE